VNCANVCRMLCHRIPDATCSSTCGDLTSAKLPGVVFVFARPGLCRYKHRPFVNFDCPTHVAFGFLVSPGMYMFGSLENGRGNLSISRDQDNGMWMANGTFDQMIQTMMNPCKSCFHGAVNVTPYTEYKLSIVESPMVCAAVQEAEAHYKSGFGGIFNNCLDAVYDILLLYGTPDLIPLDPLFYWCPGDWYNALPSPQWMERPLSSLAGVSPVTAVSCPSSVTSVCSSSSPPRPTPASTPPSTSQTCPGTGLDFSGCAPCTGIVGICLGPFGTTSTIDGVPPEIDPADCPTPCNKANPCLCEANCYVGDQCYTYSP
jgi:hypothetical protein